MKLTTILPLLPEINTWFFSIMFFVMYVCRMVAEVLLYLARKTESKYDDRFMELVIKALRTTAEFIGWFGVGKPKDKG